MKLSETASLARKEYMKSYRDKNRNIINRKAREWRKCHPERVQQYQERYFSKLAEELGLAANE